MLVRLLLISATAHAIAVNGRQGEVVGARGRIGSLLLRAGGGSLAATPRGVAPGTLSPPGTPILVAAPASAVADVLRATPASRLEDVVLLCNGDALGRATEVVGSQADGLTYGCLFFGVLSTGAAPTFGAGAPPTVAPAAHAGMRMRSSVGAAVRSGPVVMWSGAAVRSVRSVRSGAVICGAAVGSRPDSRRSNMGKGNPNAKVLASEAKRPRAECRLAAAGAGSVGWHAHAYSRAPTPLGLC